MWIFPDSAPPPGHYQVSFLYNLENGPASRMGDDEDIEEVSLSDRNGVQNGFSADTMVGVLLRNGTEITRFGPSALNILEIFRGDLTQSGPNTGGGADWEKPAIWNGLRRDWQAGSGTFLEWAKWPAGLRLDLRREFNTVPGSAPQFEKSMRLDWNQEIRRWFLAGASLHLTSYGGGLNRDLPTPELGRYRPWWNTHLWWSAAVGVPGFRYELHSAVRPLPEFYWLDRDADSLVENGEKGRVVRQWSRSRKGLEGNLAHRLAFRFGYLRYDAIVDGDAYTSPIMDIRLEDMPAGFGRWGTGFLLGPGTLVPQVIMELLPFRTVLGASMPFPTRLDFASIRIEIKYRDAKNLSASLSLRMSLDNPVLYLPGE